jgi:hypothetical protein
MKTQKIYIAIIKNTPKNTGHPSHPWQSARLLPYYKLYNVETSALSDYDTTMK